MVDKFKIYIENYNLETKNYELGKQQIGEYSFTKIKHLLLDIPVLDHDTTLPITIATARFIFRRLSHDIFFFEENLILTVFQTPVDISHKNSKKHLFKINELKEIFQITKRIKKKKKLSLIVENDYSMCIFPIANIILIIIILLSNIENLFIVITLIWLVVFSSYCAIYNVIAIIKLKKNPQKIKLEYSLPIIDKIERIDISEMIVYCGQIGLFGFLVFYLLEYAYHYSIVLIVISFIAFIYLGVVILFFIDYFSEKSTKRFILKVLAYHIQHLRSLEAKQYYSQLAIALEKKRIITTGSFSKLISILLFLTSIIPVISFFLPR